METPSHNVRPINVGMLLWRICNNPGYALNMVAEDKLHHMVHVSRSTSKNRRLLDGSKFRGQDRCRKVLQLQ